MEMSGSIQPRTRSGFCLAADFSPKLRDKIWNGKPGFEASNIPSYQDSMYVSYVGHSLMHFVDLDLENSHLYFVK